MARAEERPTKVTGKGQRRAGASLDPKRVTGLPKPIGHRAAPGTGAGAGRSGVSGKGRKRG